MEYALTEEAEAFRRSVQEGLSKNLTPRVREIEKNGEIPRDILKHLSSMGLLGITIGEEYGGMGADTTLTTIAAEEVGRADTTLATGVFFLLEAGWGYIFYKYGRNDAKEEVLPRVTSGDYFLGIASTETTGGSDVAGERTRATKSGTHYIISGEKAYISGVNEAAKYGGGFLLLAKTRPELGHKGMSMIYTPVKGMNGITTSLIKNMGREGISTGIITLNNVEVPEKYLIGEENRGFYYAMEGFTRARVFVSAASIGAAQRILELGIDYAKNREVFGKKLSSYQAVRFEAAEFYSKLEAVKALVYKAAWAVDRHYKDGAISLKDMTKMVSAAKWLAPTTSFDVIKGVSTWFGAYGYSKDGPVEASFRGSFSYLMGAEGALNVMKDLIAKEIMDSD